MIQKCRTTGVRLIILAKPNPLSLFELTEVFGEKTHFCSVNYMVSYHAERTEASGGIEARFSRRDRFAALRMTMGAFLNVL
jgi:hypothetical protein